MSFGELKKVARYNIKCIHHKTPKGNIQMTSSTEMQKYKIHCMLNGGYKKDCLAILGEEKSSVCVASGLWVNKYWFKARADRAVLKKTSH